MSHRTITLTDRPPVKIDEEKWPVLASASLHDFDGEYDFQSNRDSWWHVYVRQHEDRRALVYATYRHSTNFLDQPDYSAKSGVLLANPDSDAICAAIREVCAAIAELDHYDDDDAQWVTLANECQADMPAEALD